ncbi:GGDEF domain-containing protein [Streptomyces sp. JJ38]|uniref:GGDEF domain-containing protein n=1 Tax=Streptomyces sp. JJ38 TaxID=2738128 RepID=UPI001C578D42|nr:GGDEF domain-containing protein [Streptomyces sp. JJ38]MBW1599880.1 GGDEF domain-containing protein [Streptomyces sp. JJ38]
MKAAPRTVDGASPPAGGASHRPEISPSDEGSGLCTACGRHFLDGLTGVLDRQAWEQRARAALEEAREAGRPVALVLADLDRFKSVNDVYGHIAGDEVLKSTADVLRRIEGAVVGRYGGHAGDEFLVLLPGTGADEALRVARRALESVRGRTVGVRTSRNASVALTGQTVSMGVSGRVPHRKPHEELFELLLDCDVALRAAKRGGGDQARAALPEPVPVGEPRGEREPGGPARRVERPRQVRIPLAAIGHTAQGDGMELVLSTASAAHLREILERALGDVPEDRRRA